MPLSWYIHGRGTDRDKVRAYAWKYQAAHNGALEARKAKERYPKQMRVEERGSASTVKDEGLARHDCFPINTNN